jgi:hypothetical protein
VMTTYERVPGGEKNEKSGTNWTKNEILEVYLLFKKLKGVGLHERNPEIQELAAKLGRTVRSTEAQALMFRNLQKDGDYSHGNMTNFCREVWEEMEGKQIAPPESNRNFPQGLLDWAGHRRGGVKKPFDRGTGRPNGEVIRTLLTNKLDKWVEGIGTNTTRIILLIGGPGNGKTDALEYLIDSIDNRFNTTYFNQIADQIQDSNGIVRREVEVKLDVKEFGHDTLKIIQDASTGSEGMTSDECLIEDLKIALDNNSIYIACINRGILAEAISRSEKLDSRVHNVLKNVVLGMTSSETPLPLWPLGQQGSELNCIGVWPMDVESLVKHHPELKKAPADHIISEAVEESHWGCNSCQALKQYCPFYQNKLALQNENNRASLLSLLSDFELISNKRWTFRELFSLIAYMLVGSEHEFGKDSVCGWSTKKIAELNQALDKDRINAVWELNDHLYHFRLFSKWPSFSSIARSQKTEVMNILRSSEPTKQLFNYFSYRRSNHSNRPEVAELLDDQFFPLIDPSQLSNVNHRFPGMEYSVKEIEASFSYSVNSGFELMETAFNPLEASLFHQLIEIENELDNSVRYEPSISSMRVNELLVVLRSSAVRYAKRIYFTSKGVSKDEIYLKRYRNLTPEFDAKTNELKGASDLFDKLIQDNQGLSIVLNSSIAQPMLTPDSQVRLQVRRIRIRPEYISDSLKDVPRTSQKVFRIEFGNTPIVIPLSYSLYKALEQLNDGVRPSSLPGHVLAMLDNIKSKIAGMIVRDKDYLFNARLEVGDSSRYYRIDDSDTYLDLREQR